MNYLIYLLFVKNSTEHQSELMYSLLSFKKVAGEWSIKNVTILIYTDSLFVLPECLNDLNVRFNLLEKEEIEQWLRRGNNHALILKAVVMNYFLKQYQACGILIDTDTFFAKDPEQLFCKAGEGYLVMHLKEYPIINRPTICTFFKKKVFKHLDGSEHAILPDFYMWNSGVVGLSPARISLTNEILNLIVQIAADTDWPTEQAKFIEQTCYSYYLQKQCSELLPADECVIHYWFFKEARFLLGYYFDFFYGSDEDHFNQIVKDHSLPIEQFGKPAYSDLPALIAMLMKEFNLYKEYHFECLPIYTYIGKVIRGINCEAMMQ